MDNIKKQLIIAGIVSFIIIAICIGFIIQEKSKESKVIDLKVYKYYGDVENPDEGYYKECFISTEEQLKINRQVKKVSKIKNKSSITSINGNYKIVVGDSFYAFDNSKDNIMFDGNNQVIRDFKSDIYDIIIKRCNKED